MNKPALIPAAILGVAAYHMLTTPPPNSITPPPPAEYHPEAPPSANIPPRKAEPYASIDISALPPPPDWVRRHEAPPPDPKPAQQPVQAFSTVEIPVSVRHGMTYVTVSINGVPVEFMLDSGSSTMCLPDSMIRNLSAYRALTQDDITGPVTATLADGRRVQSLARNLRNVNIGGWDVANVAASGCGPTGSPLLGQSLLSHFKSWSVDNTRSVLIATGYVKG